MFFRPFKSKARYPSETPQGTESFLPVVSAGEAIASWELSQSVNTIKNLVAVTDQHFELYYLAPINEFLILTQYMGKDFVQERLTAVIRGLKLRRPLLLPTGVESESIRKSKDLWTYVAFVALLMYDIGPVVLGKIIVVKDSMYVNGPARRWHPMIAALHPPQVYRIMGEQIVTRYSNSCFLHRILNNLCLHWIIQDVKAFNALSELIVNPNPETLLGALLLKAHNARPVDTTSLKPSSKPVTTVNVVPHSRSAEPSLSSGEAFYVWLKNHITTLSTSSVEPYCFNSSNGLTLVCPDIFKQYANTYGGSWKNIQNDFLQLKHHSSNPKNNSDYHTLTIPGRGNVNTLILPGLCIEHK